MIPASPPPQFCRFKDTPMSTARSCAVMALASLAASMPLVLNARSTEAADIKEFAAHDRSMIEPAASRVVSDIEGLIAQGREALRRGDLDAATSALDAAITLDSANALALHTRGVVRMLK